VPRKLDWSYIARKGIGATAAGGTYLKSDVRYLRRVAAKAYLADISPDAEVWRSYRLRPLPEPDACSDSFAESEKPGGLFFTQATNFCTAGSSRMAPIVKNFFASWESVKIACI
jgi:hypothetical protein